MKRIVLSVVVALSMVGAVSAQEAVSKEKMAHKVEHVQKGQFNKEAVHQQHQGQSHQQLTAEQRAERIATKLKADLELDKKQYKQVLALFTKQEQKRDEQRAAQVRPTAEEREQAKAEFDKQLQSILTADQYRKFDEQRQARKENHGGPQRHHGPVKK